MIHCENFKAGLLGKTLGHSFSVPIHAHLADYEYKLYEVPEEKVGEFVTSCPLNAFNVTIPYKKTVMPYLTHISDNAKKIGSVNTVVKKSDGLYGYNTDYYGFYYTVKMSNTDICGKKVLVLGSGGASLTVKAVLSDMGAKEIITVSRNGKVNYGNISEHKDAQILVNTTPVGMYPNNSVAPVDITMFPNLSAVFDLIYNPSQTRLLYDAENAGIKCFNGLTMLTAQAKRACELFLDCEIPDDIIPSTVKKIEFSMKNIVLIGMPGVGKSTAGKILADLTNRKFTDTDECIVKKAEMSIPDIFSKYSEKEFRRIETEVLKEVGKMSGGVIATGGGVVTQEENYPILSQNSYIVLLNGDISSLAVDGRPISQKNSVEELYKKRAAAYNRFADTSVNVSKDATKTAQDILNALENLTK